MKRSPRYYWLRIVILIIIVAIGYSIFDRSDNDVESRLSSTQNQSNLAVPNDIFNDILLSEETKTVSLHGTLNELGATVNIYQNMSLQKTFIDISALTPVDENSQYVLWSLLSDNYHRVKIFAPKDHKVFISPLDMNLPMIITKEMGTVPTLPTLKAIVAQ